MNRLVSKYLLTVVKKAKKVNVKPVKIDFPLPDKIEGIENRLNSLNTYSLPEQYLKKNKPETLVGQNIRLNHLLANWEQYIDQVITVVGWAREARLQAKDTLLFIKLIDGSNNTPLQVVIEDKISGWEDFKKAKTGYSFRLTGKIIKSLGKGQNIELKLSGESFEKAQIYGRCDDDKYPLNSKDISLETLRDIAHLRPRTQIYSAMTRIKNNLAFATHQFFQNNGFLYIHTPLITGADCEGAGEMFQVTTILPQSGLVKDIPQVDGKIDYGKEFFKKVTNLTVSGQLAVENFCCALSNVYTFGPTFRAEVSHTSRHIAEFWMIEPELAFADVFDTMECAEAYVQFCIRFILENNRDDLEFFDKRKPGHLEYLKNLVSGPFARASYTQAIDILEKVIYFLFSASRRALPSKTKSTGELTSPPNMNVTCAITSSTNPLSSTTTPRTLRPSI
jgi:asparaginyl-tRNA synthetase